MQLRGHAVIAQPSVQSLLIRMQFDGQLLATGTAFVVEAAGRPHLITNRHNVTARHHTTNATLSSNSGIPNELVIVHNLRGSIGRWILKREPLYVADAPRWREHPAFGARADFVALPLTDLDDVGLYPYDLTNPGPDILVGPADAVSVIGFPFGMAAGGSCAIWATGFLASEPIVDFDDLPIQLIDCRTRQGQSGSPVIAYRSGGAVAMSDGSSAIFSGPVSRFVGIYSGRINTESDIGFVWKTSALQELMSIL
jgi:hypothetical protein